MFAGSQVHRACVGVCLGTRATRGANGYGEVALKVYALYRLTVW